MEIEGLILIDIVPRDDRYSPSGESSTDRVSTDRVSTDRVRTDRVSIDKHGLDIADGVSTDRFSTINVSTDSNNNDSSEGRTNYSSSSSGKPTSRIQQHLELGMQLSSRELSWLADLPFYIRSMDLGCVFVHAGFKAGKRLTDQDPWVMMTVRSLLPDGRMSPRCFSRHPWANKWRGPLTAYFGHDAARGLQMYDCAVGLDTGCVYGGHLSAVYIYICIYIYINV
jgi:hypothetical protein